MDTLNSKERIDLHLHPELEQELQQRQQQDEERLLPLEEDETVRRDVLQGDAMVRGEDLALINENKGWYREGAHGREVKSVTSWWRKCLRWREIRKAKISIA